MRCARDHHRGGDLLLLVPVSHSQHPIVGSVDQRCSTFRFSRGDRFGGGCQFGKRLGNVALDVDLQRRSHRHDRPSLSLSLRFLLFLPPRNAQDQLFLRGGFSKCVEHAEFLVHPAVNLRSPSPSDVHVRVSQFTIDRFLKASFRFFRIRFAPTATDKARLDQKFHRKAERKVVPSLSLRSRTHSIRSTG